MAGIANNTVGGKTQPASGREDAITPVPEGVAIATDRNGWFDDETIRDNEIMSPGVVDVHHEDHGGGLGKVVNQFETDAKLHGEKYLICAESFRERNKKNASPALLKPGSPPSSET
jgi:hypothetical protein